MPSEGGPVRLPIRRKTTLLILLLVPVMLVVACRGPALSVTQAPQFGGLVGKRVGVMGLKSTDEGLGNTLSDSLANALLAAGCQVVERTHLMNIAGANEVAVLESRGGADVLRIG